MVQMFSTASPARSKEMDFENPPPDGPSAKAQGINYELLCREINDLEPHEKKQWKDWKEKEFAILPHTDAAGNTYYIGDLYEGVKCKTQWEIKEPKPYLKFIKSLSQTLPHLAYLGYWMEVTAAPPKWKYLQCFPGKERGHREERAKRSHVCVVDYTGNQAKKSLDFVNDVPGLERFLHHQPQTSTTAQIRLIVAEDLSRDLVELLGSFYDIDPQFFQSHIDDYLYHNPRDPWVELPSLDVDARRRNHFTLQYLRARYFENEAEFKTAEYDSGMFNVLRRIDSDRSRERLKGGLLAKTGDSITLTRSKTSLWWKPRKDASEPVTAILLVDPTVSSGKPVWGGYRPFQQTPSMKTWLENGTQPVDAPPLGTLYEDVVYWSQRMTAHELDLVRKDVRNIALGMYRLVIVDWLRALKYVTTTLTKIEWEFEKPHWDDNFSNIDNILKKLSPWRRNIGYYQAMISEAIARLFPPEIHAPIRGMQPSGAIIEMDNRPPQPIAEEDNHGIRALWTDFRNVKQQMNESQARIRTIENIAMNGINAEEARRAVKQNGNLTRLTGLATIFIPLNFTSSFLSISPDFSAAKMSFWLFFAIGIPLTLGALLIVDLSHPKGKGFLVKKCGQLREKFASKKFDEPILPTSNDTLPPRPKPPRQSTIEWFHWFGKLNDKRN
ncbi:hypothetical protein CGMCC3_g8325 [Colletotrichum fructicola]|uniref:Uncharacterized protein n=1 Tax=Colletotrichum fructicola (strain Nara gc5) TaxID=1213859 RepID=L2G6C1_COLFN|nr:uncharacterized protein CGMCC3_g8325 [Colletotrichum fructicola]KAE9575547.1 hypothetical protein CGMCC3_g8325 [Colletotrichum fructicola]KAF4411421.1 hypothetical protein CFRS1_v006408 [Colletotrichum fructicola]KAF4484434.1 hypothetical protein CGGC5_v007282 [Colletotrichum fructicola Nara gc5]KAF4883434.1 hypothetical protein CGCFRS4_v013591 [Colletotrichum fructicola]